MSLIRLAISEMIHYCGIFALDRFEIGVQNSGHPLNQSDAKLKPIVTGSLLVSRATDSFLVFSLRSHWLPVVFFPVLIGFSNNFVSGLMTLN